MGKGWGYKNNRRSQYQIIIDSFRNKFENEVLKVYESSGLVYGFNLSIRALINKTNKAYKLIICGKDGDIKMNTYEDCREFTSIKDIKDSLEKDMKMFIESYYQESPEVEKLSNEDFQSYMLQFINSVNKNNKRENTWIRLYNDMFDRCAVYQDQDIVNIQNLYMDKINEDKVC